MIFVLQTFFKAELQ